MALHFVPRRSGMDKIARARASETQEIRTLLSSENFEGETGKEGFARVKG